ncbi:hypothetical protein [Microbacterium sp.]|uniref:hypothetical protein n=1 Tax=Microbacterium sp. TaxID=51671 RepID=UPI0039E6042C
MTLVGQLLATLPLAGALLLQRLNNLPKASRHRQYPMPFIAVLYAILAAVGLYRFNDEIDRALRLVFEYVPFLRPLYDTTWQYVIENTAIVLVFTVIKIVLNRVFDRTFHGQEFLGSGLVEDFYRYDSDASRWFVRPQHSSLRVFLRVMFGASIVLTMVFMALVGTFPAWPGFAAIAFPALAALVIGEFAYAVDGVTSEEFERDIRGDRDDATRVANYAALRSVLAETFPDRVLHEGLSLAATAAPNSHALQALTHSPHDVDRVAGAYFERLRRDGSRIDDSLVAAAASVMRGRSVVISHPFYRDLTPTLAFPAYYHLLQYRKCLIVSGRDAVARDLVEWMEGGLESITGVPGLWHVGVLAEQSDPELDVGVLRFSDLHNLDLLRTHDAFLREVEYVILAEPSRMLATGQLGLAILLARCGGEGTPAYAVVDRTHDGLVDSLSHLLKVTLTDVVAPATMSGATAELVWRNDGPPMHGTILPGISRYLGMGTEIAAVAAKYQIERVEWIGGDAFPVTDMTWIAGQYYAQIAEFTGIDASQQALADALRPHSNPWALEPADNRFLIVEDEARNLYETIRLYTTRAREQGFINVISEDYLLRDYMIAQREIFARDPKAIPSLAPDYARTQRNLVLRLALTLQAFGMTESALAREFELIGVPIAPVIAPVDRLRVRFEDDPPVVELLRTLLQRHTGADEVSFSCEARNTGVATDGTETWERFVTLSPTGGLDEVLRGLRAAYFFIEDEVEDRDFIGSVLYGLVFQKMLPGQLLTHSGASYQVQSIGVDHRRGGIVLRRAAEHITGRRVYRPLRRFRIADVEPDTKPGAQVEIGGTTFTHAFATIEVTTDGYLEHVTRSDLESARRVSISGVPDRRYVHKEVLEIRMDGVPASVLRTIAVLLNEVFVTTFPDAHEYVLALAADPAGTMTPLLPPLEAEDDGVLWIVEDSPIDLGLLVAVERNWSRLLEIIADYLQWSVDRVEPSTPAPTTDGVVVFPDDDPADLAERARVVREQDSSGPAVAQAPRRAPWWRRLWRRRRPSPATPAAPPPPPPQDTPPQVAPPQDTPPQDTPRKEDDARQ